MTDTIKIDKYRKGVPPAFPESQPKYIQDELTKLERIFDLTVEATTQIHEDVKQSALDFTELYGTTSSAADSAAKAIQAASDSIDAKAWMMIHKGDADNSAIQAQSYKLDAEKAAADSASHAQASLTSSEQAGAYSTSSEAAAASSRDYSLSASASMKAAGDSANAANTSKQTAAGYVTAAETASSASNQAKLDAQAARDAAGTSATAANQSRSDAVSAVTNAQSYAGAANTSALNAAASMRDAQTAAGASNTSSSTASGFANAAGSSAGAANQAKLDAQAANGTAQAAATAANTSASNASASATAAGQSATSASTSAQNANTYAGNALTYRNSAAQSVTDAKGYADSTARDYTSVTARLNNAKGAGTGVTLESTLVAQANSITGLQAKWGITLNNAGRIAGLTLNSGTDSRSSFDIQSDTFSVTNPDGTRCIYWDGSTLAVRGNITANNITASAVNNLGDGSVYRPVISNPTLEGSGTFYTNQSAGNYTSQTSEGYSSNELRGFTVYIPTGIYVDSSWSVASTKQYLATATIAGGTSQGGGMNGYGRCEVVVGDGLYSNAAYNTPADNQIYIRYQFEPSGNGGNIIVTAISWKLVKV